MEGNIRIYRLPKGRGMDQWKLFCMYILILPSISVTIVFIALKTGILIHTKLLHRNISRNHETYLGLQF